MPFIFFDLETSHNDRDFSQILQFAALMTGDDLIPIPGRELNISCRRMPHTVPSPGALRVNKINPYQLDQEQYSHYEMMLEIDRVLASWGPAIFVGHNSMGFDEPLFRIGRYMSLLPPYLTNTGGSGRTDTLRIAYAIHSLTPEADLKIPQGPEGKLSFSLGPLVRENGYEFTEEEAHDALADVRATIALANILRESSQDVWSYMIAGALKSGANTLLEENPFFVSCERYFGRFYRWPLSFVAVNPSYGAEIAAFDLNYDPNEVLHKSAEEIAPIFGSNKKILRRLKLNAGPTIFLAKEADWPNYDFDANFKTAQTRAKLVNESPEFRQRVGEALQLFRDSQVYEPGEQLEKQIFDGFASKKDEQQMAAFHVASWEDRAELCREFKDPRFQKIAKLIVYEHNAEMLPPETVSEMKEFVSSRVSTDEDVKWVTLASAQHDMEQLLAGATAEELDQLQLIDRYLKNMVAEASQ